MRKNDLVHLHSLLACLRAEFEARGEVRTDRLRAYEELGVTPMSIQSSRDEHEAAVLALARALAASAADTPEDDADERIGSDRRQTPNAGRPERPDR